MGKPIGQTFYVNELPPPNGAQGVFLKKVGIYFKQVSNTYGMELQVRTTENGLPTANRLPFARKVLPAANCVASDTANTATEFEFDTPVFLAGGDLYALVLMPVGGNPDFLVWTGEISELDVTTNTPIYTNSAVGDLFISSNDLSWTPVYDEDMKFDLHIASFTSLQGQAYFKSPDEEWIRYREPVGNFTPRETIYFGNTPIQCVTFNISGTNGTFTVGDTVYQGNSLFIATGIVTAANSTVIKVNSTNGAFINTAAVIPNLPLFDANASANCIANVVNQYNITTNGSNTITVPDSSQFTASNTTYYVQTNNRSNTQIVRCTSIVNATTIQVNTNIGFSDSAAVIGAIVANGAMHGGYSGGAKTKSGPDYYMVLDRSSANSSINLSNNSFANCQLIGAGSGASAWLHRIENIPYNSITPHFLTQQYANTHMSWYLQGVKKTTFNPDPALTIAINNGLINELTDIKRVAMSRSNEIGLIGGNSSILLDCVMQSENSKISPVIDSIRSTVTLTNDIVGPEWKLHGYRLAYQRTSANSNIGANDIISSTVLGNTTTGWVVSSTNNVITVANVHGKFIGANTAFTSDQGVSGYITSVTEYGEFSSNVVYGYTSRYVSKNVILESGQDSEDMITYLTAYRPAGTDWLVYAKIINTADNELFGNKDWSRLFEIGTQQLYSSTGNIDDRVEIQYGFPVSQLLYNSNTAGNTSVSNLSVTSTQYIIANDCVYISAANGFNVRKVVYVTNATSLVLDRPLSFIHANAAIGVINGLESTSGAFLYDQSNNVVRYATPSDGVFERYIQFAIKIVPISDNELIIPRCADLRSLCLQV